MRVENKNKKKTIKQTNEKERSIRFDQNYD